MRKTLVVLFAFVFVLIGTGPVFSANDVKDLERMHPAEREMEWFCPWCGSPGQGPGPSKQTGMHMTRGHGQERGYYCQMRQLEEPLTEKDARRLMHMYASGNPNLKVGDITEREGLYVGTIVTRDGSLVEKVLIDRKTGWMRVEY